MDEHYLDKMMESDASLSEVCLGRSIVDRRSVDSPVWSKLDHLTDEVSMVAVAVVVVKAITAASEYI